MRPWQPVFPGPHRVIASGARRARLVAFGRGHCGADVREQVRGLSVDCCACELAEHCSVAAH
eukprot:1169483-Rhodomonas_salina.3